MLQYRFVMERLLDVPPEAFDPPPKVDSAVVRLIPRPAAELSAHDEKQFATLVSAAFAQRRKMLRNSLQGLGRGRSPGSLGLRRAVVPRNCRSMTISAGQCSGLK
jgi:16S rRNA (adenine1518-N6/adenine1519-N6)-dimethyltransferase